MWLFVGLGNPGSKYLMNRHNVGFMVLDVMADMHGFPAFRSKFHGLVTESRLGGEKVILLKPQTYMNESGQSVQAAASFYNIEPDRIIVFHDELDLEPGRVRVKKDGGHAGHNGLRSIQKHLGTADFYRVRIGIGHPGDKGRVSGYVLSDFSSAEKDWLPDLVGSLAHHADLLVQENMADYMSKVAMDLEGIIA